MPVKSATATSKLPFAANTAIDHCAHQLCSGAYHSAEADDSGHRSCISFRSAGWARRLPVAAVHAAIASETSDRFIRHFKSACALEGQSVGFDKRRQPHRGVGRTGGGERSHADGDAGCGQSWFDESAIELR